MPVKSVPTVGWTRRSYVVSVPDVVAKQQEEIAQRVRALMEQHGWTNFTLAVKSGLSEKTISRVINATHEPRADTIRAIAKAFRVPERDVRGDLPDPFGPTQLDAIENEVKQLAQGQQMLEGVVTALAKDVAGLRKDLQALRRAL